MLTEENVDDEEASTEFVVDDRDEQSDAQADDESDNDSSSSNEHDKNSDDDDDDNDDDDDDDDDNDDDDDDELSESEQNDAAPLDDAELDALAALNGADEEAADAELAALPADSLLELQGSKKMKERAKAAAEAKFFAAVPATAADAQEFSSMQLSRPLLKAIADLGWDKPTPIQSRMIPVALLGRDICANAVTGYVFCLLTSLLNFLFTQKKKNNCFCRLLIALEKLLLSRCLFSNVLCIGHPLHELLFVV